MERWFPPEAVLKRGNAKGGPPKGGPPGARVTKRLGYLTSTVAPSSSSWPFALSATSFATFSRTGAGALSTRSFASLRPRLVIGRTALVTLIFLSPTAVRTTSNSVCSSGASAAPPPPGACIMTGAAAAAVTSKVSSNCLMKSDSSRRVISLKLSSRSSVLTLAIVTPPRSLARSLARSVLRSRLQVLRRRRRRSPVPRALGRPPARWPPQRPARPTVRLQPVHPRRPELQRRPPRVLPQPLRPELPQPL